MVMITANIPLPQTAQFDEIINIIFPFSKNILQS